MVDWKEQHRIHMDKEQTRLSKDGCVPNTFKFAEKELHYNYETKVLCPFCLTLDYLYKFPKKDGLRACVNCGNKMMTSTLVKDMTTEEFAQWVFDYRKLGFWQKVYPSFQEWKKRLKDLGLAYDFWEYYNKLKGALTVEQENEDY